MSTSNPTILALDFDGVICDGLIEYFHTAWRAYCQIWFPASTAPPEDLAPGFYRLRPVVEIGWEMPVLLRALLLGIPEDKIWQEWSAIALQIIQQEGLQAAAIGATVDKIRDEWIASDLDNWLSLHRFYPGVVEKLCPLLTTSVQPVIVTTKEGRFVQQLLQEQNIEIPVSSIYGKECQRPKHQTLRELIQASPETSVIWFVEDRLKTLQSIQQHSDLDAVRLFLADWGYNTPTQHESIRNHPRISLLSLSQFTQDFSAWPQKF